MKEAMKRLLPLGGLGLAFVVGWLLGAGTIVFLPVIVLLGLFLAGVFVVWLAASLVLGVVAVAVVGLLKLFDKIRA